MSINVAEMISCLPSHKLHSLRIVDTGYDYSKGTDVDQTGLGAEAAIEVILEKLPPRPKFPFTTQGVVQNCVRCLRPIGVVGQAAPESNYICGECRRGLQLA